jgi:hypothetical protein
MLSHLWTSNPAVAVAILLTGYSIYHYIIYPIFLSPLSKLPAAHISSYLLPSWIWHKRRIGYESRSIFAVHQQKGPIVLLAPGEVSVASLNGLRQIYTGGFERTDWFLDFMNYDGTPNLVTLFDSASHARRKRMLSNIYSKSYLLRSPDFRNLSTVLLFQRFLPVLEQSAKTSNDEGVNVFELGCAAGAEFISAYEMGLANSFDIVRMGKEEERKSYLENGKRKLRALEGKQEAAKELERQCMVMCEKADEFLSQSSFVIGETSNGSEEDTASIKGNKECISTYPVVFAQLSASLRAKEGSASSEQTIRLIASELLDNIEAGREGIGIAITYIMYQLSQRPPLQHELREELLTLDPPLKYPDHQSISATVMRELDRLTLLDAVILETLRLNAPAPGPQRRAVPDGGTVVEGYFIPAGVTISTSPYTMNRNEDVFPQAETWKPQRWIESKKTTIEPLFQDQKTTHDDEKNETIGKLRRWFWTFGSGGRMCLGNNFTLLGKSATFPPHVYAKNRTHF